MLTSLSRSIRQLLATALARPRAAGVDELPRALPAAGETLGGTAVSLTLAAPRLRLVGAPAQAKAHQDISIAIAAPLPGITGKPVGATGASGAVGGAARVGASSFVAGSGARLYSLEVFRRERRGGRPGPAPKRPQAA